MIELISAFYIYIYYYIMVLGTGSYTFKSVILELKSVRMIPIVVVPRISENHNDSPIVMTSKWDLPNPDASIY